MHALLKKASFELNFLNWSRLEVCQKHQRGNTNEVQAWPSRGNSIQTSWLSCIPTTTFSPRFLQLHRGSLSASVVRRLCLCHIYVCIFMLSLQIEHIPIRNLPKHWFAVLNAVLNMCDMWEREWKLIPYFFKGKLLLLSLKNKFGDLFFKESFDIVHFPQSE